MENSFFGKTYVSFFLFLLSIQSAILTSIQDQNDTVQIVRELEKQKDNLYDKIQDTIQKNIDSLSNKTDRGSISVLESIKELKKNVENEDVPAEITEEMENEIRKLLNETLSKNKILKKLKARRQNFGIGREQEDKLLQEMRLELFSKHKGKNKMKAYNKAKHDKFLKMVQDRIHSFLADRDLEYSAIFNKTMRHGTSKCPRRGYLQKSRGREVINYPCCRKCCKSSYMGCL